jgi:hypothetical protein
MEFDQGEAKPVTTAQRLLNDALPRRIGSRKGQWRCGDADIRHAISYAERALDVASTSKSAGAYLPMHDSTYLQSSHRRIVLRCPMDDDSRTTCVMKLVFLPGLKRKLRYRCYGLFEAANLVRARQLGIRVPAVYGCGELLSRWRIPVAAAVLMEDLADYRSANELLRIGQENRRLAAELFDSALPLFVDVYRACCNHIDMHSHNVMLPVGCVGSRPALVDFEYAAFGTQPNAELLPLQAGKFARSCQRIVPKLNSASWFARLLDTVEISGLRRRDRLFRKFNYCRQHKLSVAERLYPTTCAA